MSMHEYEDLIEMSVRALARSKQAKQLDLRSVFFNLYELQSLWDTSLTYFRVMDLLLEHKFFYCFEASRYPEYDTLELSDSDWLHSIFLNPNLSWHAESNPVIAYVFKPLKVSFEMPYIANKEQDYVFIAADSLVISELVKQTVLPKEAAQAPLEMSLFDVAHLVILEASLLNDKALMAQWYALLPSFLLYTTTQNQLSDWRDNKQLQVIKELIYKAEAHKLDDSRFLPSQEDLEPDAQTDAGFSRQEKGFFKWWCYAT